ncbi:MAG: histidine phosphatase family protein [Chlamydiae bacterium]|nr:histidine phosphatase family protein [Chlamydiota bacterium]
MVFTHHKIYLIRHGETDWTVSGRHTGRTDVALTSNGQEQAKKLGLYLKETGFQKIFCSPSLRAKETCRLAGFIQSAIFDDDLQEWDYGNYEGLTSQEIRKNNPQWTIFSQGAPGGESVADVGQRANRVLGRLRSIPGDIAIFSSGHILRSIAARWLDMPVSFGEKLLLSPASISILGFEKEATAIAQWNQTHF